MLKPNELSTLAGVIIQVAGICVIHPREQMCTPLVQLNSVHRALSVAIDDSAGRAQNPKFLHPSKPGKAEHWCEVFSGRICINLYMARKRPIKYVPQIWKMTKRSSRNQNQKSVHDSWICNFLTKSVTTHGNVPGHSDWRLLPWGCWEMRAQG